MSYKLIMPNTTTDKDRNYDIDSNIFDFSDLDELDKMMVVTTDSKTTTETFKNLPVLNKPSNIPPRTKHTQSHSIRSAQYTIQEPTVATKPAVIPTLKQYREEQYNQQMKQASCGCVIL